MGRAYIQFPFRVSADTHCRGCQAWDAGILHGFMQHTGDPRAAKGRGDKLSPVSVPGAVLVCHPFLFHWCTAADKEVLKYNG